MGNIVLRTVNITQDYLDRNFATLKSQAEKENILYIVVPPGGVIKNTDLSNTDVEITIVYTDFGPKPSQIRNRPILVNTSRTIREVKINIARMSGIYSVANGQFLE